MDLHTRALTHWVATIIDQLVQGGVDTFVIAPGSRSTPLALAAARHPKARVLMQFDERSAGFFALGLARQTGRPTVLICTSGTAAANFLPAVAEADLARVPLLLLTADRPPELRDNGAPQTIDQVGIYGSRTRWFSDLPTPDDSPPLRAYLCALVARAIAASLANPAGPVHLNVPFREPLLPDRALLEELFQHAAQTHPVTAQIHAPRRLLKPKLQELATRLAATQRGLVLCGPETPPDLAPLLARLAELLGYPILADPLSGVRCGQHNRRMVLSAYDAFLRDEGFVQRYAPELLLRFGAMPTAKPILLFLQRYPEVHQIVVDEGGGWREPTSRAAEHLATDPVQLCTELIELLTTNEALPSPSEHWVRPWLTADRVTRETLTTALNGQNRINEPGVFARLAELLPDGATLFVGNSMPIRDCDTFFPAMARHVNITGNRGANGIDGLISTGLGMAAGGARPLVLVVGDLSLYHDSNGLLAAKLHALDATIIVINNDGGGIFSFLPQAQERDHFELLFGTPHGLEFAPLAAFYGARYSLVENWELFDRAVTAGIGGRGLHLIEVRTERNQNVTDHRLLWPLVGAALRVAGIC